LNRGNARSRVFHKEGDFAAFVEIMAEASLRHPMRVLAYCLVPNHFHLALWPALDGDLSRWMHWLLTTHVHRYQRHYHSSGHIWQGRFKSFPIQEDDHLRVVLRYIERNPLRAGLVERAEDWRWSSLQALSSAAASAVRLDPGPAPRGANWVEAVNAPMFETEVQLVRESIRRDRPLGDRTWTLATATKLGLEYSLHPRGRPPRSRPQWQADVPVHLPPRVFESHVACIKTDVSQSS
jgi:putative transposase